MQSRPDVFGRDSIVLHSYAAHGQGFVYTRLQVPNIWPFIWKLYTVLWGMRYAQLKENASK